MLDLFVFSNATFGFMLGRFAVLLVAMLIVVWATTIILAHTTKHTDKGIGFSNWMKICAMYGIVVAISMLCIISIFTIRYNGLYYFASDALSWSWYCGYILMIPEIILLIMGIIILFIIKNNVKKSLN